jgi:hypothetical protein
MSSSNPFLDYAEKQTPAAVKARQRAAETRRAKAAEKALAERDTMFGLWKVWRKERLEALLSGPHGNAARELVDFLRTMTLYDEARLLELIRTSGWIHADTDTKFEVLSLINIAITTQRERAGLPPIDDPIGEHLRTDENLSAFLLIREMFR